MKETRKYGLFDKIDGKWIRREGTGSYRKSLAVKIFQNALINGFFDGKQTSLRPVKE